MTAIGISNNIVRLYLLKPPDDGVYVFEGVDGGRGTKYFADGSIGRPLAWHIDELIIVGAINITHETAIKLVPALRYLTEPKLPVEAALSTVEKQAAESFGRGREAFLPVV